MLSTLTFPRVLSVSIALISNNGLAQFRTINPFIHEHNISIAVTHNTTSPYFMSYHAQSICCDDLACKIKGP